MVGLEKQSKDHGFGNFVEHFSLSRFGIVTWTQGRLRNSFLKKIFLPLVDLDKEYMKLNVGQVVDSMTRGSCIPTDSVKSGDNHPNLVHNIGVGAYTDSDKTNLAYLVG